jgi:RNA polymerase sigma-70 factor (ECF subfamily)
VEVVELVRGRVRVRFALTAEAFVRFLLTRAREAGFDRDPASWARLLSLDDLYLAQACALRDAEAWAECSAAYFGFMRDFAGRFLRGADAAEVTDRVVAELWEKGKLAGYEGRSSLRTWLGTVVAHAALQAGKTIRRREIDTGHNASAVAKISGAAIAPEDAEAARLLAEIVADAIQGLPRDDRLLLLLHYEESLTLDEISPMLGSSKATLSRRLKRVREDIRAAVERVARERYGMSGSGMRARLELGQIDLDLSALLRGFGGVKGNGGTSL